VKRSAVFFCVQVAVILSLASPALAAVKITSILPSPSARGTTVVISGSGFSTTPASDSVFFKASTGTVLASATSATTTTLNVIVPATAVSGNVYVQVGAQ